VAKLYKNETGFTAVEAVLVVVIVVLIGASGWFVYKNHQKAAQQPAKVTASANQEPVYKRTTTVPASWKTYANKQYSFSFSYPPDSNVETMLAGAGKYHTYDPASDAFDYRNLLFEIDLVKKASQNTSYCFIDVLNQNVSTSIAQLGTYLSEQTSHSALATKSMLLDGHQLLAVQISHDAVDKEYYIGANARTYIVDILVQPSGLTPQQAAAINGVPEKEALTIFESLKIH
jgi:hypothetical protein